MQKIISRISFLFLLTVILFSFSHAQTVAVSEAEAIKTSKQIETGMNSNDASTLNKLFDITAVIENIRKKSVEAFAAPGFAKGFAEGFNMASFGNQTLLSIKNGSYAFLRTYVLAGKRHMLFRMFGDGGLNYHDYSLIKVNGQTKADDVYSYVSGEELTTTVASVIDITVQGGNIQKATDEIKIFQKMRDYKKKQDYAGMATLFESMGDKYKTNKGFQLMYIEACSNLDTEKYKQSMENFALLFPDATNVYLLMLDAYYLGKQYDKALDAINKLDSLVKGDPFLDFYRGNLYLEMGKNKEAKNAYEKIFAYDPLVSQTISNLVVLYVEDKEYNKAKTAIDKYSKQPGFVQSYIDELYTAYPELKP